MAITIKEQSKDKITFNVPVDKTEEKSFSSEELTSLKSKYEARLANAEAAKLDVESKLADVNAMINLVK